ncbi:hypothetical protein [uncultured Parabacteroides sp.]|jgi:formate/nitrite transporter FocA (FNT family)|nr:hypothetical protein [uncultured Parabacteroides sp.]
MKLDMMTMINITGIIFVAILYWWTSRTRSGRRWLKGDDEDKR